MEVRGRVEAPGSGVLGPREDPLPLPRAPAGLAHTPMVMEVCLACLGVFTVPALLTLNLGPAIIICPDPPHVHDLKNGHQ